MPVSFQQPGPIAPAASFGAGVAQEFAQTAPQTNQLAMAQQAEQLKRQQLLQQQAESQQFLQQRQQQIDQQDPMQHMPLSQTENMQLQQLQNGLARNMSDQDLNDQEKQQIQQQVMPAIQKLQKRQRMGQQQQAQQQKQSVADEADMLSGLSSKHTQKLRADGTIGQQDTMVATRNAHGMLEFKHIAAKTDPTAWHELQMKSQKEMAEFKADRQKEAYEAKVQAEMDKAEAANSSREHGLKEREAIFKMALEHQKNHSHEVTKTMGTGENQSMTTTPKIFPFEKSLKAAQRHFQGLPPEEEGQPILDQVKQHVGLPTATTTSEDVQQQLRQKWQQQGQSQLSREWSGMKRSLGFDVPITQAEKEHMAKQASRVPPEQLEAGE